MTESMAVRERLEFRLNTVAPAPQEGEVRRLFEEAVQEAVAEAREAEGRDFDVRAEIRGAFGGVGELVALLWFLGKAVGGGIAGAAGKDFYDRYLKPRLERRGLFPSEPETQAEEKR
jgi:hypothetical protein